MYTRRSLTCFSIILPISSDNLAQLLASLFNKVQCFNYN